jgi:hypothetical protein
LLKGRGVALLCQLKERSFGIGPDRLAHLGNDRIYVKGFFVNLPFNPFFNRFVNFG